MARPKMSVRGPSLPTDPSRTFHGAGGRQGVSATMKEKNNHRTVVANWTGSHVQQVPIRRLIRPQLSTVYVKTEQNSNPARPQIPAKPVTTEQDFKPTLEEKRYPETPICAGVLSAFPAAAGRQATAAAAWPSTLAPAKQELGHGAGGRFPPLSDVLRQQRARLQEIANQSVSPAARVPASISTATGVGRKPMAPRGLHISVADLVSEGHLLLKEKADKLGVSLTTLKNRRKSADLGRWPGRIVRAELKLGRCAYDRVRMQVDPMHTLLSAMDWS